MLCFCIWQLTQKRKAIHKKEKQKEMERNHTKTQQEFFYIIHHPFFIYIIKHLDILWITPLENCQKFVFIKGFNKGLIPFENALLLHLASNPKVKSNS